MERFLIRESNIILPACGGISTLARGATLDMRWLHEPQPISNQPVGLDTVRGGVDPGDLRFRRRAVGVVDEWKDFLTGGG